MRLDELVLDAPAGVAQPCGASEVLQLADDVGVQPAERPLRRLPARRTVLSAGEPVGTCREGSRDREEHGLRKPDAVGPRHYAPRQKVPVERTAPLLLAWAGTRSRPHRDHTGTAF